METQTPELPARPERRQTTLAREPFVRPPAFRSLVLLVLAASTIALLSGCATSGPKNRAKLSQAVEEAAKNPEDQKTLRRTGSDEDDDTDTDVSIAIAWLGGDSCDDSDEAEELELDVWDDDSDGSSHRPGVSLTAVTIAPSRGPIERLSGGGIELGIAAAPRLRLEGGLQLLDGELDPRGSIRHGIAHVIEVAADARVRYSITPEHTLIGLHTFAGMRVGYLHWDYRNPLFAVDGYGWGEEIEDDGLPTFSPYVGAGVSALQLGRFHWGASLLWGARLHGQTTEAGFANDVFGDGGFTELRIELGIR